MDEYVDLSERVTATFYSDECEEWTQQTVSIADVLDAVCDDYTVLPSAQPEQRWIPCSKRLPDKDGRYLVTNSKWGSYHVDWNIYYAAGDRPGWLWEQGCTAWMPLPEPWRGEEDE